MIQLLLSTGSNSWLEKKDETYLQEYIPAETSTGMPKYYAMFGGATGVTDPLQEDCSWRLHPMTLMYLKFTMKLFQMGYLAQMQRLI
jgi:hypothetical protein